MDPVYHATAQGKNHCRYLCPSVNLEVPDIWAAKYLQPHLVITYSAQQGNQLRLL